jgi:hypothetical protein
MKFALIALLTAPALALASNGEATLRAECAAKNPVSTSAKAGRNEYTFAYHKGSLRGEVVRGKKLPCAEGQYTAYVASLDPARVMAMNPTAAGKPAAEEHVFSYKKGKLAAQ